MKQNIFQRIRAVITGKEYAQDKAVNVVSSGALIADVDPDDGAIQVTLLNALNGQVLRMATYKRNPHGPDWTHKLYIIERGQSLAEAVAVCLVVSRSGS